MSTKKRVFIILFIVVEIAVFIALGILLSKNITLTKPISINLDQTDWIAIIVSLGGSVGGWIALFKKEAKLKNSEPQKTNSIIQKTLGDHSPIINTKNYTKIQYNSDKKE